MAEKEEIKMCCLHLLKGFFIMTMEEGCGCCAKKRGQYELHQNLV